MGWVRVVRTRIEQDGTMQRRVVDPARQRGWRLWADLAGRAMTVAVPYRPVPAIALYHVRVDGHVVMAVEPDLAGALLDLVTGVMALGEVSGQPL